MSDPVQITAIVCATIVLIIFGLAAIQMIEKLGDKKHKQDETEDDFPGLDNMP
jgi:uncharacterized protein YsxB (DUF464 family)